jgi:ATP-dependent DNA helicase 2 subunit 2
MCQQKIFNNKTHEIGLILFGAEEDGQNSNILYIREMAKPDLDFVRNIIEMKNHDPPENIQGGVNQK